MNHHIDKYKTYFVISLLLIGSIFFIFSITQLNKKTRPPIKVKAANVCGCTENGSCNLNGQYCENFLYCDGINPIFSVYICNGRRWQFAYSQRGGYCSNNCGAPALSSPTPGTCRCEGGLFNVIFRANRPLNQGESITCTISGQGRCSCGGSACSGGYKERACEIGPGISQCGVSGLDCNCKPFNYNCTGSAQASGTFTTVNNGGSETVSLSLPQVQSPPTNTPTVIRPTNTPTTTPAPTNTPTNTPTVITPTNTPINTPTNTPPVNTPTSTPTQMPNNTPQPTNTPTNIPNNTPTNTPLPTSTPTPTEIILAQVTSTSTSIPTATTVPQTIPESGRGNFFIYLIPIAIILISLIF